MPRKKVSKAAARRNALVLRQAFDGMGFDLAAEWVKAVMDIKDPTLRIMSLEKAMKFLYPELRPIEVSPTDILDMEHADIMALEPAKRSTEELLAAVDGKQGLKEGVKK